MVLRAVFDVQLLPCLEFEEKKLSVDGVRKKIGKPSHLFSHEDHLEDVRL